MLSPLPESLEELEDEELLEELESLEELLEEDEELLEDELLELDPLPEPLAAGKGKAWFGSPMVRWSPVPPER